MSTVEVRVPDIGDSKDVAVVDILVAVGAEIRVDDPLITLESEKASMDVPSTVAGKVISIAVKKGLVGGNWGVVLTSVRYDQFLDPTILPDPCLASPGCYRESTPSQCVRPSATSRVHE